MSKISNSDRLAHGNRSDARHDLAFGQMAMAHNTLMPVFGFQIGMLGDEGRNLGIDGLGEQRSRTIAKNFRERIGKASWLNQLGDVILRHGISLH